MVSIALSYLMLKFSIQKFGKTENWSKYNRFASLSLSLSLSLYGGVSDGNNSNIAQSVDIF